MPEKIVKIQSIEPVTHDVRRIVVEKPAQYAFTPGQATDVSINKPDWKDEKRPFTFTCLPTADYLEFNIKTYPARKGVTNELLHLNPGDELILHDVFGAIAYKGEGVFIAGGAGVTPFIGILRYLHSKGEIGNNILLFANKTKADIILEAEFTQMLGSNFVNILSDEKAEGYFTGEIKAEFIKNHSGGLDKVFYVCGPPPMMEAMEKQLAILKIDPASIVKEAL